MTINAKSFTDAQKRKEIINRDSGSIIVSASAGSGKTKLLIDRLIRLISTNKALISEILAVTFTEAAALEMKEKLKSALISEINKNEDKGNLASQLSEVSTAEISTVHSFCSRLIRTYFYVVGVSPDYKVADENKCAEYRRKAVDRVIKECYEIEDLSFLDLLDKYKEKRKDDKIKELILDVYSYCISEPEFTSLFEKTNLNYSKENLEKLYEFIIKESKPLIRLDQVKLDALYNYFEKNNFAKYTEYISNFCEDVYSLLSETDFQKIKESKLRKFPAITKDEKQNEEFNLYRNELYEYKNYISKQIKKFLIERLPDKKTELEKIEEAKHQSQLLFELVKKFHQEYSFVKSEEKELDFNDLEHYALKILQNEAVRENIKSKYKYIFVDEYQDTNGVQEEIFSLIHNDNIFMVGDLKQSIYGFRGCRMEFFKKKFEEMSKCGQAYELSRNFRSAENILEYVNSVFEYCMTEENTGIDYKNTCTLVSGGLYENDFKGRVALHKITKNQQLKEEENPRIYDVLEEWQKTNFEEDSELAEQITEIINQELLKTWYDPKDKCEKMVTYSDICILSKSIGNKKIKAMTESLTRRGIPVTSNIADNVLEFPEVIWLWETLKLCNCFYQDIPLATALKSPLGRFTDEDLLEISKFYPKRQKNGKSKASFSEKFQYYLENADTTLNTRLKKFYEYFSALRFYSDFASAYDVMRRILQDSNAEAFFVASVDGENKVKRLKRFVEASIANGNHVSVLAFLNYLQADGTEILLAKNSGNAVKIMTVHSSKGLQFPVVILCGLEKSFNAGDERGSVIKDRELGLALKYYNSNSKTISDTIYRQAVIIKKHKEMLKEEARVLYVAMTRATYSLHMIYEGEFKDTTTPFLEAKRPLDYLPSKLPFNYLEPNQNLKFVKKPRKVIISKADKEKVKEFKQNFDFKYKYLEDTTLPLKCSVTETIKKTFIKDVISSQIVEDGEKTSRESGIAAHKFLELIDFSKKKDYLLEKERLLNSGLMKGEEFELFDLEKIGQGLNNSIFEGIENKNLMREREFIVKIPAFMVNDSNNQTEILLQGVVDLVILDGETAQIIDYKYSRLSKEALKEKYKKQIKLYAYAVEKILNVKVTKKAIFSLLTGEVIETD